MRILSTPVLCLIGLPACNPPPADAPRAPAVQGFEQVVPGAGLPVTPMDANNNLDVIGFAGRTFLAFRTAPDHFASPDVQMHVVSSTDGLLWDHETTIALGTDVREPNFVAIDGGLHLFYAVLGDEPLDFEPQGTERITRNALGDWTAPVQSLDPSFIPWRIKDIDGTTYMVGYTGGGNIYDIGGDPIEIHWLTTDDGEVWDPVVPGQPVVQTGGGSETDFVFLDDGAVVAVTRNEAGDELGFGSKICRAEAEDLGTWTCNPDPRKYDSPLVFRQAGVIWLVARRNVTDTGHYDLQRDDLDPQQQYLNYQWEYWHEPKRCALWQVDPDNLTVSWELDLPSRGDTCFPELLEGPGGEQILYNYSSDPDGPDYDWIDGQHNPTNIYRMELIFP